MPRADQIVRVARSMLGTPFRHQGRDVKTGIDCVGFGVLVMRRLGVEVDDRTGYRRRADGQELLAICRKYGAPVALDQVRAGDAMVFAYNGTPDHFAFVGERDGRLTLIHAFWPEKRVVEHGLDDEFRSHAVAAYRFTGDTE